MLGAASAPASDATHLDILVATTRAASSERGVLFSGEWGEPTLASFVISIPSDESRQIGQVQWPRTLPSDSNTEFATLDIRRLSRSQQFESWLGRHAGKNVVACWFLCMGPTQDSALFSFAQISHDSGAQAVPVLFSWPSWGGVFNYLYDRESAAFSRDALEKLLPRLAASPEVREISVLAHSMGAWLTMESLRQMAIRDGRQPFKIKTVILASPDLDVDVFRAQLKSFGEKRPSIVVFLSRQDRALQLSRGIDGNVERLGAVDPSAQPWIDEKGVEVVDLRDAAGADPLRHGKFAQSQTSSACSGRN